MDETMIRRKRKARMTTKDESDVDIDLYTPKKRRGRPPAAAKPIRFSCNCFVPHENISQCDDEKYLRVALITSK